MDELVERINKVREYKGVTGKVFANMVEIKYTTVYNYLIGKQIPSSLFLLRILSVFNEISAEWLMRGTGSMIRKENKESELIKELADTKVKLLVAEGITKKLTEIVEGRMTTEQEEKKKAM